MQDPLKYESSSYMQDSYTCEHFRMETQRNYVTCKTTTIYLQRDLRTANRNRVLIDDFMTVDKSNPVRISLTVNGIRVPPIPSINYYIYEHPACSSACAGTSREQLSLRFPVTVNSMVTRAREHHTYNYRPARRWSLIATSVEGHSHRYAQKKERERKKKTFAQLSRSQQRSHNSAHVCALILYSSNYFRNFAQTDPYSFTAKFHVEFRLDIESAETNTIWNLTWHRIVHCWLSIA